MEATTGQSLDPHDEAVGEAEGGESGEAEASEMKWLSSADCPWQGNLFVICATVFVTSTIWRKESIGHGDLIMFGWACAVFVENVSQMLRKLVARGEAEGTK